MTPGDFAVDVDGVWRANSLTGTVRRYSDPFRTCRKASQTWNVTAKRTA